MADSRRNEHREPGVLTLRAFHGHRQIEADGYLMSLMVTNPDGRHGQQRPPAQVLAKRDRTT